MLSLSIFTSKHVSQNLDLRIHTLRPQNRSWFQTLKMTMPRYAASVSKRSSYTQQNVVILHVSGAGKSGFRTLLSVQLVGKEQEKIRFSLLLIKRQAKMTKNPKTRILVRQKIVNRVETNCLHLI